MGKVEDVGAGFQGTEPQSDGMSGFRGDYTLRSAPIKSWDSYEKMDKIPDNYFWTSIEMMIKNLEKMEENSVKSPEIEYVIQGLKNTLKEGYNLEKVSYLMD